MATATPTEIGNRIRTARKQKGLSQTELANLLGKSMRTIQKYESGEIEPSIAIINEIAKRLDVESAYLMGYGRTDETMAALRLAVYLKGKSAKKYRHNREYGSARWGTAKDIEPFMAPKFEDNIILTKTEGLMMSNRPKNPANARNKNVLVVGGSGSGKTRFFIKPNLLQCNSKAHPVSFVVTDPKGSIVVECGNALLKHGYRLKIFNTINFKKSMHYNPFAYIHSEKDILKLVTTLITNTKGDGKGGDPFWEKAETLLYTALIGYIHYEAPGRNKTSLPSSSSSTQWRCGRTMRTSRTRLT